MLVAVYNLNVIVKTAGFTLLELLVVIAIIGLLSAVVFGSLSDSKVRAREVVTLKEIRKLNEAIFMYELDTSTKLECLNGQVCTDKLISNPGISGWDGPYLDDVSHVWGGEVVITKAYNITGLGPQQTLIFLTNDRPGFGNSDNTAKIPNESILRIDEVIDDGNISTGLIVRFPFANRAEEGQMLIEPNI